MDDGGHRTQLRKRAPEPVTSAEMCRVQSSRLATVEALSQIMRVPEVEVPDLWTLDAHNAEEMPRRHLERPGFPRRHREFGNFGHLSPCPVVKCGVERWQLLDRIRQRRRRPAPRRRVRGVGSYVRTSSCSQGRRRLTVTRPEYRATGRLVGSFGRIRDHLTPINDDCTSYSASICGKGGLAAMPERFQAFARTESIGFR
jgi:hypothetical protein